MLQAARQKIEDYKIAAHNAERAGDYGKVAEIRYGKMAQAQTQFPRLATAIKQTEPILKEDGLTVVFKVGNSAQQSWIEKNSLPQLIGFLQKELNNGEVKIVVEVIEVAQQKKVPYTAYENAEQMRRNYPQVVELTKDLDLDII